MTRNKQDYRFQQTQVYILTAMTQLLRHESFEKITVKQICERAGIGRSTFYLHYVDKVDLVTQYQTDLMMRGAEVLEDGPQESLDTLILQLLTLLEDRGALFLLLLTENGSREVQRNVKGLLARHIRKTLLAKLDLTGKNPATGRYFVSIYVNAVLGGLQEWGASGQRETPAEMVTIIREVLTLQVPG